MTVDAVASAAALATLPPGVEQLAGRLARAAVDRLAQLGGPSWPVSRAWVRRQLALPLTLEPQWPRPATPLAVGAGAVHADLADEDAGALARLREAEPTDDPEVLARAAQGWRLPVTPYRLRPGTQVYHDRAPTVCTTRPRSLAGLRVLDLSALWAGPLATALLCRAGVQVTKLDPACRRDGLGAWPALYQALNACKTVIDLDLRVDRDRRRFEQLLRRADLVIDSFSRRVMPNLGYAPQDLRRINPNVASLSIVAFPDDCPERDWIAYGGGVAALSGLGDGICAAALPYPDPLAGLRAFAVALQLLARGGPQPHAEVSLLGTLAPLLEKRRDD